jgi:hypothetical protein
MVFQRTLAIFYIMRVILRKIDSIVLGVSALAAIVLCVLDFTRIIPEDTWKPSVLSLIILMLLALITIHLIVSHFIDEDFQAHASKLIEQINASIALGEVRKFKDSAEIEHYLAKRVLEAKFVCDLSWKSRISEAFSSGHRQASHGSLDQSIAKASDRASYREIFVFSDPRRIEKLERRLHENKDGYSCAYYKDESRIPRLQFVIIDDEEILFFAVSAHSQLCAIRSPELIKVFKPYFEEAWSHAVIIKQGKTVHQKEVEKIRKHATTFEHNMATDTSRANA